MAIDHLERVPPDPNPEPDPVPVFFLLIPTPTSSMEENDTRLLAAVLLVGFAFSTPLSPWIEEKEGKRWIHACTEWESECNVRNKWLYVGRM